MRGKYKKLEFNIVLNWFEELKDRAPLSDGYNVALTKWARDVFERLAKGAYPGSNHGVSEQR
jgi:hypothetical protein